MHKKLKAFLLGFLIVLSSSLLPAQEKESSPSASACAVEVEKYCPGKIDFGDIGKCLITHENELSTPCRQELTRLLEAKKGASARGGGALSAFGGLNAMGPPLALFSYDGRHIPGKEGAPNLNEHRLNLSLPVMKTEKDTFAVSLAAGQVTFDKDLFLDTGVEVPTELTRLEIGTQYFHQMEGKRSWGLRTSLGYAGDEPMDKLSDATYSVSGSYGYPGSGNGYWMLFVFMSNNNPIANFVPIPGVAYIYRSGTFSGMFGFPILSMQWTPVNPWVYSLSIFGPTLQAEAAYGQLGDLQFFSAYSFSQQNYIPSIRAEDRDRLTIQEQRFGLGTRIPVGNKMLSEIQAGRSFERSVYVGKGSFKKEGGSVDLPTEWYASWSLKYAF